MFSLLPQLANQCPMIIMSSTSRKAGSADTLWHCRYDPDCGYVKKYGDNKYDNHRKPE